MPNHNLAVLLLSAALSLLCYSTAVKNRYASSFAEAIRLVHEEYLEEIPPHELYESAMTGMVGKLDQYSQYFGLEAFRRMEESLDQRFGGIGIVVEKTTDEEPLVVLSPIFGTPAYRAGMRAGDRVMKIDGVATEGMKVADAIRKMRGPPGSQVELSVVHAGETQAVDFRVIRSEIPIESVLGDTRRADGSWDYRLEADPRIGYLRLTTFGKQTVEELTRVLTSPSSAEGEPYRGILLDLRGNAGGLLSAAVETCDLFLEQGRIVSTRGRGGDERDVYNATPDMLIGRDVPMVILVNRYSASASEIVAACLQDHGRAVVVGERTWGKGTVQDVFELDNGRNALKITTASYWRPSGQNIHRPRDANEDEQWGVRPNEGFQITLSDDEVEQIQQARYRRDLPADAPVDLLSTDKKDGAEPGNTEPMPPLIDPQLTKAREYLQQQIARREAVAG